MGGPMDEPILANPGVQKVFVAIALALALFVLLFC